MKLIEIIKYVAETADSALLFTPPIYTGSQTYFIKGFQKEISIKSSSELHNLEQIDSELEQGKTAIGLINYEFGYSLESGLKNLLPNNDTTLLQFLIAADSQITKLNSNEIDYEGLKSHLAKSIISEFSLDTSKENYIKNVKKIKDFIRDGDTYQVNYTVKSKFKVNCSIIELFVHLLFSQSAKYIALINLNDRFILSASPELFFEIKDDEIITKPMKGTIHRGNNNSDDFKYKSELLDSKKDQAENIMIVDLLRNDLGKICKYDSIHVQNRYEIEKYESIFQLTSTIIGTLKRHKISDIVKNLFPNGSITGAPKIRTMEIIKQLENGLRGIYTGSIGLFSNSFAVANVAIRTLTVDKNKNAELGIGSGIVWDSDPKKEYEEVLLKSVFLRKPSKYFEVFETMLVEKGEIFLIDYHLQRLKNSCDFFLFRYPDDKIKELLNNELKNLDSKVNYKLKLRLTKWGKPIIETSELIELDEQVKVKISESKIDSDDKFQYFKTTNRDTYDEELIDAKESGFDELIYFNEKGKLAEGSFTNILLQTGDHLYTPTIESGILNGCYREYLLQNETRIVEKELTRKELINAEKLILINSVRKEIVVSELYDEDGVLIKNYLPN